MGRTSAAVAGTASEGDFLPLDFGDVTLDIGFFLKRFALTVAGGAAFLFWLRLLQASLRLFDR